MGEIYDLSEVEGWRTVERQGAHEVLSHLLLPVEAGGRTRLAITKIEPGGTFGPHVDDYAHVICVVEGHGEMKVGGRRHPVGPGSIMRTDPGEPHGMWAAADEPLVMLAANVYAEDDVPAPAGG